MTINLTRLVAPFLAISLMASPARCEIAHVEEGPASNGVASIRIALKYGARAFNLFGSLARPGAKSSQRLLIETEVSEIFAPLAVKRGAGFVGIALDEMAPEDRDSVLRDVVLYFRKAFGATKIIGAGRNFGADALIARSALFDALLLGNPRDAPPRGKAPLAIVAFGADAFWRDKPPALGVAEAANQRRFYISGASFESPSAICAAPANYRPVGPALRALYVALDEWLDGKAPPSSLVPKAAELAPARNLTWPKLAALPAPADARSVPKIDADGNETAGLRLPDQALPVATFTGFNWRRDNPAARCGGGAAIPFATTRAERDKIGDPRLSLVERYGSRAYFAATMRVVADKLVKERLLLPEDADAYVADAKKAPF
ncbi:MAG: alpha/beta hydrolase domain-containing protein [Methylocystis sp.]|nr:alpha/beta hydrolase domain-containing protein [Methylocystis sp.]